MKILAFDIGGTDIKYGICDEDFNFIKKGKTPSNAKNGGKAIIQKIKEIINCYDGIDKIGISTAGQVDSSKGEIVYSTDNIPEYTGTKLKQIIEDEFNIPTFVENDVNAAAIGENIFGAARGCDNFICLTYGTGIGGAIVIDGKIFKGSSYSAGEMGHIITHPKGKLCTCGGYGCYECYASTSALSNLVFEKTGKRLNGREIFSAENKSNDKIMSAINCWIDEIVLGLISIAYVFNPSLIVAGGGIMNEEYIIEQINDRLPKHLMQSFKNIQVVKSQTGNDAGMLGAAYMASKL